MQLPPCPRCQRPLPVDLVRVGDDAAPCPACGAQHRLSDLAAAAETAREEERDRALASGQIAPPPGAWLRYETDGARLGATHRAFGTALIMLGVSLFWNGIVSLFVLLATVATLRNFGLEPPDFLGGDRFQTDDELRGGFLLFLWLFLTPFILLGAGMLWAFFNALAGRTELRLSPARTTLFTGIGPLGRTRAFDPASVRAIRTEEKTHRGGDGSVRTEEIVIEREGAKDLRFGSTLSETRRDFLVASLRQLLLARPTPPAPPSP